MENKNLKNYDHKKVIRFNESKRLKKIKKDFTGSNALPDIHELQDQAASQNKKIVDEKLQKMITFKEETLEKLPYFQEINVVSDLIKADPNLQDYNAEQALEALVAFNDDMKKLAVNAYQMELLASYSL